MNKKKINQNPAKFRQNVKVDSITYYFHLSSTLGLTPSWKVIPKGVVL